MKKPDRWSPLSERGALDPPSSESTPNLSELAHQADRLEDRIHHLKTGINNLLELQQIQAAPSDSEQDLHAAQTELAQLQTAVETFEVELASRTITWKQLSEPFWQAVRYGGLGFLLGWGLHWLLRS